ncbi:MAG: hypothetical protein F6K26_24745 [Moorea sp. SIO2I5]|nr:hypothetical protein [Moorena sp. SIO2I5]
MNRSRAGILPARKYIETGKMPVPRLMPILQVRPKGDLLATRRAPTLKIIPLLSNALIYTRFL